MELIVRHGVITAGSFSTRGSGEPTSSSINLGDNVVGQKLHELRSWEIALSSDTKSLEFRERESLLAWLQQMLPEITD